MGMRDITSTVNTVVALNYSNITSNTTTVGNIIDMEGYSSIVFTIDLTAWTDGVYTPILLESDYSNMASSNVVAIDDMISLDATTGLRNTTNTSSSAVTATANTVNKLGYIGGKRYIQLEIVSTSVSSGAYVTATAIQGDATRNPIPYNGVTDIAPSVTTQLVI